MADDATTDGEEPQKPVGGSAFAQEQMRKIQRRMERAERMRAVAQLRVAGVSVSAIAKQLGISQTYVRMLISSVMMRTAEDYKDAAKLRALESMRLDDMQMSLWPKRDDPMVAATIANIMRRRAEMWGLDAPEAMRIVPPEPAPTDIDVNKLSAEEAIVLRNILVRQQAERNAIDVQPAQLTHEG